MNKKAFTLVELLVVVAIIGILAAILVPNVRQNLDRAKIAKTKSLISNIEYALTVYKQDTGNYPESYDLQNLYISLTEMSNANIEADADEVRVFPDDQLSNPDSYWEDPNPAVASSDLAQIVNTAGVPTEGLTAQMDGEPVFVDAWNRPIYYISSAVYNPGGRKDFRRGGQRGNRFDDPCAYELRNGERFRPYNPTSFQLISFGPDGTTYLGESGLGGMIDSDKIDNDGDGLIDKEDTQIPAEDDITNFN